YFHQTQRQQQQLLLMEERSIIARELHDSLAQVLSFLQIQLTLLKHSLAKDSEQAKAKSQAILTEFEQALSDGCLQLRELLATFRLTVQEANLKLALEQVIDSLRNQTESHLSVACSLPSQTFTPQQLIHALQIVREATLNAVKHAKAKHIEIIAHTNIDGEQELLVRDDGIGIPSLEEPEGHYGLRIMEERSRQLNATLTITNRTSGGTEVKILLPNIIKTTH
ncbi:histidine kinase, partial [Lonepinella koalarum]